MFQGQEVWYTLARPKRQRAAMNARARRTLFIFVILLLSIPAVFISINTLLSGEHTWGLHARQTNGAWQVTWVGAGLAEGQIEPGDQILLADDQFPTSEDQINQANTLQVLPAGQTQPHSILWHTPSQADNLLSLSWMVLGAVSLLLGLLIFLHATERSLALRFFLLWATLAFVALLEPATPFGNLLAIYLVGALSVGLFFGLLTSFLWLLLFPSHSRASIAQNAGNRASSPAATQRPAGHRWLPEIPIATGVIIGALYFTASILEQQDLFTPAVALGDAQAILGICLSLFFMLRAGLSRRATIARERARTLLGGTVLGLTPLLVLTLLPSAISGKTLVPGQISALALVALPLSFAYAIVRRDLLRVDSLIRNTVLVLLTVIGMAIAAVFLAELLSPLPTVPALVLGVIAGALLAPLMLNTARWITEAWLFPQVRRYRKLIASGESIERSVLTPERLAGQLVGEVHLALPVRQVAVFAPDKSTGQLVALSGAPASAKTEERAGGPTVAKTSSPLQSAPEQPIHYQPLLLDDVASARLSRAGGPILIAPAPESAAGEAFGSAQGSEPLDADTEHWRLLIPMRVHGRLVGVLALAHREDEQDYSDTDLQLLRFLAGRRALALDYSLLYADLHAAYEQRRELDAAKDRFIVTAHHELRTPLTGVQGYLELLRGLGPEGRDMRPKEVDIFIEHACQSADELSEQLDSLLRAAEMTFSQTQIRQQPVAVSAVAQHAMHSLEAQARRGNYRIRNQIPPDLLALADEEALYRIFMNLLSNALKYSAEGRPILFEAHPLETGTLPGRNGTAGEAGRAKAPMARISVRDWGTGINPKDKYKIFERFTRLERELNSPVRGSGLGLAICKELVTAMGGSIDVISDGIPGAGSEFWFTLPLASASTIARP
jgi:signal transduction histidine kinase